ncbi:MAG: hypothetical protein SGJ05_05815 [bacterium]|nr:hypothetical protein [bacterium]
MIPRIIRQAKRELDNVKNLMQSGASLPDWVADSLDGYPSFAAGLAILAKTGQGAALNSLADSVAPSLAASVATPASFTTQAVDLQKRLALYRTYGRWFPERQMPERFDLSAITGLASILRQATRAVETDAHA